MIFWALVMARFLIPLSIPKYPLPGIIASLVLDAIDKTIFQLFTDLPLDDYQGYDKALDIYYLTITYLSTLRDWSNLFAFRLSRFLFYYRLVGAALFGITHLRALLFIFPNVFEYFFIFYEAVRLKWDPQVLTKNKLIITAALIWIFVKVPQEYWIHIAEMSTTDWIMENPANTLFLIAWASVLLFMTWWLLKDLPPARPGFSFAADPIPSFLSDGAEGARTREERKRMKMVHKLLSEKLVTRELAEKIVLISLLSIIFAEVLPGVRAGSLQVAAGLSILIVINTALSQWLVRRGRQWRSIIQEFVVMSVVNFGLILLFDFLLPSLNGSIDLLDTLFFVLLLTLNVTLYDRYRRTHIWSYNNKK
ncbi:hypothetical protein DU80_06200 [Methanosarcina mazei]|uniref:Uncharacterized protein n=6 Tax=Methanosarcina mazei TaxID=2209 RepID=A0A0F8LM02_METMZ|nr:conserved protein [Methanosarcina mazei Go1]KKG01065.1 hypothetical protein DU47_16415 [Methanosarcina mazei]KKG06718.1 hypothetical protein DU40_00090 [Methanosarcina mazei]KKG07184.1 hypothetical protein DU31_01680 [Methanosarcina mazei]KKG19188.1 hypothetical protein DU34_04570 [Methanosarcina mazei]